MSFYPFKLTKISHIKRAGLQLICLYLFLTKKTPKVTQQMIMLQITSIKIKGSAFHFNPLAAAALAAAVASYASFFVKRA